MTDPHLHRFRRGRATTVPATFAAVALFHLAVSLPAASAQSVDRILADALAAHEARLAGIRDVTIVQQVMGFPATVYMVKETVGGAPVLVPRSVGIGGPGISIDSQELGGTALSDAGQFFSDDWRSRWTLLGRGEVDGRATWRLQLTNFEGLNWTPPAPGQSNPFTPERMVLDLEADRYVPLRLEIAGTSRDGGQSRPASMVAHFQDYRTVSGFLHPFLIRMEVDMAATGMSEAELAEARAQLEALRSQLDQMPEGMRAMLQAQLDNLQRTASGDRAEIEIRTTDVRVNQGPPPGA